MTHAPSMAQAPSMSQAAGKAAFGGAQIARPWLRHLPPRE
jgi:hypothetical protein